MGLLVVGLCASRIVAQLLCACAVLVLCLCCACAVLQLRCWHQLLRCLRLRAGAACHCGHWPAQHSRGPGRCTCGWPSCCALPCSALVRFAEQTAAVRCVALRCVNSGARRARGERCVCDRLGGAVLAGSAARSGPGVCFRRALRGAAAAGVRFRGGLDDLRRAGRAAAGGV